MNLKEVFINWIYKNSNPNLTSLPKATLSKNIDESNGFFDRDIMEVDDSNYKEMREYLQEELYRKNNLFQEFNAAVASGRPRAILGKENYLKFLDEKFGSKQEKEVNFWIFQGSPEIYDIERSLRAGHLKSWKVAAHKDKIKPGDKVILWQTGNKAGCYALAEVVSEVGSIQEEVYEQQYYKLTDDTKNDLRVKIRITNYLADNPVLWEEIKELPEFSNFKAGNQGTNFSATKEEFETIDELGQARGKSYYREVKKLFPKDKVESFLNILRSYLLKHRIEPNDDRISFNVRPKSKRLVFLIGNRYALSIEKKRAGIEFSFISPDIVSRDYGEFANYTGKTEMYWNKMKMQ